MKNKFLILLGVLICINSCRMPADPIGEIIIIKRLNTIDTEANCLDIDVDMVDENMDPGDSILVAAANTNGYFVYKINSKNGVVSDIIEQEHVGADEMDNSLGDNRAQSIILSKNHNIAFVTDQYDHIWLYKYENGAIQYNTPNYLEEDCYGGTWLDIAIDDQQSRIGIYTLLKHNAAQFVPYCIHEEDTYSIPSDAGCSEIEDLIYTYEEFSCPIDDGYRWVVTGCAAANQKQFSTSIVWNNLDEVDITSTSISGEPDCEYMANYDAWVTDLYYADSLLTIAYGEEGIKVFKQMDRKMCINENNNEGSIYDIIDEFYNLDICEDDFLWENEFMIGNGIWDEGEESLDCKIICEDDDEWIENMGNGKWDPGETFIDCHKAFNAGAGCDICEDDENWKIFFGNQVVDSTQSYETFTDCAQICEGDATWNESFGNGIWDGADGFINCDMVENGVWDEDLEYLTDCNSNSVYIEGSNGLDSLINPYSICECMELWKSDFGNGIWDGEEWDDENENGVWDEKEILYDYGIDGCENKYENGSGGCLNSENLDYDPSACDPPCDPNGDDWIVVTNTDGSQNNAQHDSAECCPIDENGDGECSTENEMRWFIEKGCDSDTTGEIGRWDPGENFIDKNNNGIWDDAEEFDDENGDGSWTPNLESFVDGILVCEGDPLWGDRNVDEYYNDTMVKFGALDSLTIDYNNNGHWDAAEPLIDCRAIGQDYFKDVAYCESLGGQYISQGGFSPELHASFDTPGEVETVYSKDRTIFAGLSHSNGFMITKLNDDGSSITGPSQFATGYSIRGIHENNGLLALAAGHDGILLYDWNGGVDVSFIGKIETSYANNVKVAGSIIFAATEDGIEIIQIDH